MARIYISLGSNIERESNLNKGLNALEKHFGKLTLSSLFESEPVGFVGELFYNMVIACSTSLSVEDVAKCLREIEFCYGRTANATKFSSRTLDLDLLLYDNLVISKPVQLPRDEITKNAFVLWPLAQVAGDVIHPTEQQSIGQLWQSFNKNIQQLKEVPFNWQTSL